MILVAFKAIDPVRRGQDGGFDSHTLPPAFPDGEKACSSELRWLKLARMSHPIVPQEEATIRAFIVRARRDRFLELLPNPKKRSSITKSHASLIGKLLRSKGAGEKCWAISEDVKLDGREVELDSILSEIVGYGMGTILCCVPGKLAFVESENGRFILQK